MGYGIVKWIWGVGMYRSDRHVAKMYQMSCKYQVRNVLPQLFLKVNTVLEKIESGRSSNQMRDLRCCWSV